MVCQSFMHSWVWLSARAFKFKQYVISMLLGFFETLCSFKNIDILKFLSNVFIIMDSFNILVH